MFLATESYRAEDSLEPCRAAMKRFRLGGAFQLAVLLRLYIALRLREAHFEHLNVTVHYYTDDVRFDFWME